jgi:hypothetical protein
MKPKSFVKMAAPSDFEAITAIAGASTKIFALKFDMQKGMHDCGHRTAFWSILQGI